MERTTKCRNNITKPLRCCGCTTRLNAKISAFHLNGVCNKTNEKHQFLKFIFGMELYMFRTVSLPIIRSLALYTQQ